MVFTMMRIDKHNHKQEALYEARTNWESSNGSSCNS